MKRFVCILRLSLLLLLSFGSFTLFLVLLWLYFFVRFGIWLTRAAATCPAPSSSHCPHCRGQRSIKPLWPPRYIAGIALISLLAGAILVVVVAAAVVLIAVVVVCFAFFFVVFFFRICCYCSSVCFSPFAWSLLLVCAVIYVAVTTAATAAIAQVISAFLSPALIWLKTWTRPLG